MKRRKMIPAVEVQGLIDALYCFYEDDPELLNVIGEFCKRMEDSYGVSIPYL